MKIRCFYSNEHRKLVFFQETNFKSLSKLFKTVVSQVSSRLWVKDEAKTLYLKGQIAKDGMSLPAPIRLSFSWYLDKWSLKCPEPYMYSM